MWRGKLAATRRFARKCPDPFSKRHAHMVQGLQISARAGSAALTPEQKRFNTLIRQIDQARRRLATWQEQTPLYAQAYTQLIVPLMKDLAAEQRSWAFGLDRLLAQPGWTRAERDTLRELLCDAAAELLSEDEGDAPDAALKALFDKHAEVDFDTEQQQSRLALKDMVETVTGMDLGDDDIASDADLFKRMQQHLADDDAAAQAEEPPRRRRKSKALQQREAEAQLATQSVREVFRKLASALHPDRESDDSARQAKTALMQKANQAYAANDLLTLLELQLQVEQVDAGHIAQASTQRVRHYNKVLAEQLDELKAEIDRVEMGFRMDFGLEPGLGLNPNKLFGSIEAQARDMRAGLALRRQQLRKLDDRVGMKRWLKRQRQRLREPSFDDDFF